MQTRIGKKLKPIEKYLVCGHYDSIEHSKVTNLNPFIYNNFLMFNNLLPQYKDLMFDEYDKYNKISDSVPVKMAQFKYINEHEYNVTFYSLESLYKLLENTKLNLITIPVLCFYPYQHLVMIIIDKKTLEIYIFDSNNDIVMIFLENIICKIINSFNIKYFKQYTVKSLNLNNYKKINSEISNKGFCITISMLIPHYMKESNLTIYETLNIFSSLKNNILKNIIEGYTLYYYYFICV